ncbi:hypothetical protein [Salibaculum griseiflavum]|uniref:hypothetical protein n=1 Tax=Salibaculum griseiflavum TaxID=1914409 RepID=UPI0011B1CDE2|nr:hypothetical protein [Salibaculum griseiflavum]
MAIGTDLISLDQGFLPTREFLYDPYVNGFFGTQISLMKDFIHKGGGWSELKSGEYFSTALEAFRDPSHDFTLSQYLDNLEAIQSSDLFGIGKQHAETVFGAMQGLLPQSDDDPIVVKARKIAASEKELHELRGSHLKDKDVGFKTAILRLTIRPHLLAYYGKQ